VDEQPDSGLPSIFDDGDAYDLVLKDILYGLDFRVALARKASGPVLDITRDACRHHRDPAGAGLHHAGEEDTAGDGPGPLPGSPGPGPGSDES